MRRDRPALKGILFDKDGTLLDFEATWGPATAAVVAALAQGDPAKAARLAEAAGFDPQKRSFEVASPIIAGAPDEFGPVWARLLGVPFDARFAARMNALFHEHSLVSLTGYEDVAPGLDAILAMGLAVGLATNDTQSAAHAHLERLGVRERFAFVAGYDSGHGSKPGPGMVHAFARAIGAAPEEVAMIGDTGHDMAAAKAAGALAVGLARTPAARAALDGLADLVIDDLAALCTHLEDQRRQDTDRCAG
ncbi:HAD family hydrolase [Aureimonas populi]|uniref:phosphoglycolate phosphatase n=1 Tax=Aureimonas populi TaxID=1701758 RepID=A0ABW5CG48_9HYPH|nr:HAD family hydrolase [Aureimonas populi]